MLGETTQPNTEAIRSFQKITLHHSVKLIPTLFSFMLPMHKADRYFKGSTILIESRPNKLCPYAPFIKYLAAHETCFPFHAQLWLRSTGEPLTYSWVICQLKSCLGSDIAGHSLHSGGATTLTLTGTPDDHIQACGRWSSQAYHIYIRKHPMMLQSLLHGHSAFDQPT